MDRQAENDAAEQRRQFSIGAEGNDIVQSPAVRAAAEQRRQEAIEAETRQFHQPLLAETNLHLNCQTYGDDGPAVQAMIVTGHELCVNTIRDTFNEELHDRHDRRSLERAAARQAARAFTGTVGVINPGEHTRRVLAAPAAPPTAPIALPTTANPAANDDVPPAAAGAPQMGRVDSLIRPSSKCTHPGDVEVKGPRRSKRLKMESRRYNDDSDRSDEFDNSEEKDEFYGFEDGGDDYAAAA
ncbi:hypothetical protein BBJ28_00013039 [Nothophytophthora sp. Chile5]|nr:hypothetical protein BBJ28_00013039 [Nothophytophthora sp. Chile5]